MKKGQAEDMFKEFPLSITTGIVKDQDKCTSTSPRLGVVGALDGKYSEKILPNHDDKC